MSRSGSKEQMQDIMAGKYQFASTAFDNIVAYTEGQGTDKFPDYDVVAIAGVHSGMNSWWRALRSRNIPT